MKRSLFILILFRYLSLNSGQQPAPRMARLIGGHALQPRETGYLVSLQAGGEHFCGGGIVHERYVLSAAHCFLNDGDELDYHGNGTIKVVAGTNDLARSDDEDDEDDEEDKDDAVVEVGVEKIYVPASYNHTEWRDAIPEGDIAVLKLERSLDLRHNPRLSKLRLPRAGRRGKNKRKYRTYEGESVLIAGFGWDKVKLKRHRNETEYEVGSSSDRLYGATARVISNEECQQHYTNVIRESELCARVIEHEDDTPQGVCRGDSGGPLVHSSNTIIGVVSGIAMGCNENDEPGIYSRVSAYVGFVRDAMRGRVEDMRVFQL